VLLNSYHTGAQPSAPLIDCLVNDILLQTRLCTIAIRRRFRWATSSMGDWWATVLGSLSV